MRSRHGFRPSLDGLEDRLVMDNSRRPVLVLLEGLRGQRRFARREPAPSVVDLVNQSFDSFTRDFSQVRGTYYSAIDGKPVDRNSDLYLSFVRYTTERVDLLANELKNSSLQGISSSGGKQKDVEKSLGMLPDVISRKINGRVGPPSSGFSPQNRSLSFREGTLGDSLIDSIPPASTPASGDAGASASTTVTGPAATLYSMAQDEAIASARVAVINGINVYRATAGGKKS